MKEKPFWQTKSLEEMTPEEWESLCDGCARCCLFKFQDEDTGEYYYTDVACKLLDLGTCQCTDYPHRRQKEPGCVVLTAQNAAELAWMPETCAYRRLALGRPLPRWHPLRTGNTGSVAAAGIRVCGMAVSANDVPEDELENHIISDEA
ncbi:MAG: YcgN family cysteine cluster protein [Anaerolineaceae bacterium]|nr:YcgN family cysteine cluster protein [Anaerolineaceae bacterium]